MFSSKNIFQVTLKIGTRLLAALTYSEEHFGGVHWSMFCGPSTVHSFFPMCSAFSVQGFCIHCDLVVFLKFHYNSFHSNKKGFYSGISLPFNTHHNVSIVTHQPKSKAFHWLFIFLLKFQFARIKELTVQKIK